MKRRLELFTLWMARINLSNQTFARRKKRHRLIDFNEWNKQRYDPIEYNFLLFAIYMLIQNLVRSVPSSFFVEFSFHLFSKIKFGFFISWRKKNLIENSVVIIKFIFASKDNSWTYWRSFFRMNFFLWRFNSSVNMKLFNFYL